MRLRLAGLLRLVQGQVPQLLRHPCGAAVVDELYGRSSGAQRNALAAEFFGKEYVLFSQVRSSLVHLCLVFVLALRKSKLVAASRTRRPTAWQPCCGMQMLRSGVR